MTSKAPIEVHKTYYSNTEKGMSENIRYARVEGIHSQQIEKLDIAYIMSGKSTIITNFYVRFKSFIKTARGTLLETIN